ncbi:ribonuclease H-like domain-containing protein [Tanacetum coccineum]|uniref:Ribonuclease H-like domain-containing protein n=2 Tax=Tanacetum coccineum TaxID=301880 RepID=A0ABQ5BRB2_9ASTR
MAITRIKSLISLTSQMNRSSDIEDSLVNDRYAEGMHAVPLLMTRIYILSGPDVEIDEIQFTYGPKQSKPSESDARSSDFNYCESNSSEETLTSMPEPVVNEPKVSGTNVQRVNHQNQFVPKAVLTRTGRIPVNTARASSTNNVNTARHNFNSQAAPTNAARKVNTVKPIVNNVRPKTVFHKTQSPIRRPFYRTTTPRTKFSNQKVNTAEVKAVSAVGGKRKTVVKPSAGCNWRIKRHYWNKVSKYNGGSNSRKYVPHKALENKGIVDSGCSRHMTGNKAYLAEYQDYNGGPVAFGGSKGYITGKGKGPNWLFDLDYLTDSMNYQPVRSENQAYKNAGPKEANHSAGTQDNIDAENSEMEAKFAQYYFVLPIWSSYTSIVKSSEAKNEGEKPNKSNEKPVNQEDQAFLEELERLKSQEKEANDAAEALRKEFAQETGNYFSKQCFARASSTNTVNTASTPVSTASPSGGLSYTDLTNSDQDDTQIPALEDSYDNPNDGIFTNASYDDEGAVADFTNLETIVNVSPIPTSRIHSVHPSTQILGDPKSAVQTRSKVNKSSGAHAFVSYIQKQRRNNHKDFQHCLFACFLSQNEPKKISEALEDESWIDAMQEELLQFKIQKVWILVDLPHGKKAIGTKWVYRNKKDERGVVELKQLGSFYGLYFFNGIHIYQNGCEECIPFMAQLMRRVNTEEELYTTLFIKKDKNDIMLVQVYVDDIIFGSTKRSWCDEFEALMKSRFQMSSMGELTFFLGLQVTPKTFHLNAVKRIFRYLKGKPKLGLWYPRVSSFDLEAYSDSDYVGANFDKKSTTGEAEYVAAANCCGQVLWIQNQMLDYGFNFMNTNIYIDNESTICILNNPVFHSKTKHIAIRHHFIWDAYKKKLIQVLKIHTDDNVADLLTKAFDVSRESLERDIDGTEELLLRDLFIFWLTKVSTDSAKLIPLGKDSTSIKTLEKIPPRSFMRLSAFLREAPFTMLSLYITAKVAGKPVSISEASIRSDLLFDDADGIDSLPNQAIFDAIQLMGFILVFLDKQLKNVPVPLDHFPINALTSKVFSFMVKKGKHFLGNVTPLFDSMLVQQTKDEGDTLERQSEPQPIPSPPYLSVDQHETQTDPSPRPSPTTHIPDSIPEGSGGNHRDQAKEIKHLNAQIKKIKKKAKPVITHHRAWMKSGRKSAKAEPTVHKDPAFDELDDDAIDYMEAEDAQDVGRTSYVVHKEKESAEKGVSTEDPLSTAQPKVSTDKPEDSTDKPDEAPTTTTPTIFGDDETIAQVLIIMSQNKEKLKEKEKGVELKDVEETERPRPTSTRSLLTLKPLPKIDPKDKGKKMIEEEDESDTDSEDITEAKKKFKQLARDEEVARNVQEDWEAEEEVKKLAEEEATKAALSNEYDFIQARLNADKILAEKLQEEEREMYTIKQRAKFLHDTIAAQRRFLAQQRYEAIRNKPPSRNQLMIKRSDDSFIAIGYAEDKKVIKEMNEQVADDIKREYQDETPEGFDKILWGDLIIMFNQSGNDEFWNAQQNWKIVSWKLHSSSGIHTIMTDEGIVIHMLVENKYPLKKEVLSQLLKLKLETEEDSTMALELIRFVKKQIAELEPEDSDGDEKDL